ncbi:bacteriohemerythrin [Candidatus Thiodiazotropha sp. CDECU1]|uniref:bacteriohemerythrin n=1 Tax=Candidatus Thiodiazotropha sp. CDECU1 TaxID=3065865 RepID=UPI0029306D66|nr:bacteriohemerythrin [Candidatus Thiodiazotropha sp. CDECU1]
MAKIEHFQPIEWEASMATGVAAIDKQHKYLIDTLQTANETLLADDDVALLKRVANDLLGYAITHFETEEELMQRYGYTEARPEEARAHIAQHRDFSCQIVAVHEQLREGKKVSRIEVLRFLNHWLRDHVLGVDQLLGKYLVKQTGHETKN